MNVLHRNINDKINDLNWRNVLNLYSGLFEEEKDREDFIVHLIDHDVSLAAQCETSSINKSTSLEEKIVNRSQAILTTENLQARIEAISALIELEKFVDLVELYQNAKGRNVSFLKQGTIPLLTYYSDKKISSVVEILLKASVANYLLEVLNFITENVDALNVNAIEFNELLDKSLAILQEELKKEDLSKASQIFSFLKLYVKHKDKVNLQYPIQTYNLLSALRNKEDLEFLRMISAIRVEDVLAKYLKLGKAVDYYAIWLMQKTINRELIKETFERLLYSREYNEIAASFVFISSNKLINNYKDYLFKKSYLTVLLNSNFHNGKFIPITNAHDLSSRIHTVANELKRDQFASGLHQFIGREFRFKIITKWKHHYVLGNTVEILSSSLLPFEEANEELIQDGKLKAVVIYSHKKSKRLIVSMKQLGQAISELHCPNKYLNWLRKGDLIQCKIYKDEELLRATPVEVGKGVKLKIANNDFDYSSERTIYSAEVIGELNYFTFLVKIIDA